MDFCKAFNAETQNFESGMPIPVVITVYADRSFTFITKTPPASFLLRKAAAVDKGSGTPNTEKVGKVTREQLEEIARLKEPDLTAADMDAAVRIRFLASHDLCPIQHDLELRWLRHRLAAPVDQPYHQ